MTRLLGHGVAADRAGVAMFGGSRAVLGQRGRSAPTSVRSGELALYAELRVCVTVGTLSMIYALVTHDFSVSYVAQVGSRSTPLFYTVISLWGALEGSILFWAWVLRALQRVVVTYQNRDARGTLVPYAAACCC